MSTCALQARFCTQAIERCSRLRSPTWKPPTHLVSWRCGAASPALDRAMSCGHHRAFAVQGFEGGLWNAAGRACVHYVQGLAALLEHPSQASCHDLRHGLRGEEAGLRQLRVLVQAAASLSWKAVEAAAVGP